MDDVFRSHHLEYTHVRPVRATPSLVDDVRRHLLQRPRSLPPKYFYDDRGSQLFESICETEEYYPTRTESALLAAHASEIIGAVQPVHLLELGSGSSRKTRLLLDGCEAVDVYPRYWPFDVSVQMMLDAGAALIECYDWLQVHALSGDYTGGIAHLPLPDDGSTRLIVFLGGTLGNFEPAAACEMLVGIRELIGADDALLLGLDRVKDIGRLEAAYDDAQDLTAAFNRNVLHVLNRELAADFPVDAYRHSAVFNREQSQIEMRLIATRGHQIRLGALDTEFDMDAGEAILTEISRKFTPESIDALLAEAGLTAHSYFDADDGDYSLVLAGRADNR